MRRVAPLALIGGVCIAGRGKAMPAAPPKLLVRVAKDATRFSPTVSRRPG
jgi:hypothetical protein